MRIGLVRHFRVNIEGMKFMTSRDFEKWVDLYNTSGVIENEVILNNIEWDKCYSSDLPRALKTAQAIFKGEIIVTPLLREVPSSPVFKTNLKLPHAFWSIAARIAWFFSSKSQNEVKKQTEERVKKFLDDIEEKGDSNILVVCHGFFMYTFQKELLKRGFRGKIVKYVKNGRMYLFKNK